MLQLSCEEQSAVWSTTLLPCWSQLVEVFNIALRLFQKLQLGLGSHGYNGDTQSW
jgi:hypothetical protein